VVDDDREILLIPSGRHLHCPGTARRGSSLPVASGHSRSVEFWDVGEADV
jgi:hypothetical protein